MLKGNTLPSTAVVITALLTRPMGARITVTRYLLSLEGRIDWRRWWCSKNPAYVGVHEVLQLQVVLDQAFIEAAIVPDSGGVALNNDSSTCTTICVKEHHHHKDCQGIYPSLPLLNFHFSTSTVPLYISPPTLIATWSYSTISHTLSTLELYL